MSSDWYSLIWQVRLHSQDWNHSVAAGDAPVRSWSVKTCSEEKFACRSASPPPVPLSFVLCPSAVRSSRCTVSALRAHNSQCASIQRRHSPHVPLSIVLCPSAVRSSRCTVSALRAHNSQCASIQRRHSPHVPLSIVLCPSAVRSSRSFVSVLRVRHSQRASIRRRGIPSR